MTPNIPNDDCSAFRVGDWSDEDGSSGGRYAIFTHKQAQKILGLRDRLDQSLADVTDAAHELTGWHRFECGPGRPFGRDPHVRVYKHAILVFQRTGLDI